MEGVIGSIVSKIDTVMMMIMNAVQQDNDFDDYVSNNSVDCCDHILVNRC